MAQANLKILAKYLNRDIPNDDYVFRRIEISKFLECNPKHKLEMFPNFFRNEKGNGMSVDWERICNDPKTTQTRGKIEKNHTNYGVAVLSVFDIKNVPNQVLRVVSDQKGYDCHCLVNEGFPMSKTQLKKRKKEEYAKLSDQEKTRLKLLLIRIREHLCDNAFWIIPINHPELSDPMPNFNYYNKIIENERIREFFSTRNHPRPS